MSTSSSNQSSSILKHQNMKSDGINIHPLSSNKTANNAMLYNSSATYSKPSLSNGIKCYLTSTSNSSPNTIVVHKVQRIVGCAKGLKSNTIFLRDDLPNFSSKSQPLASSSNHTHASKNTTASVSTQSNRNKSAVAQKSSLNTDKPMSNTEKDNSKCKVVFRTLPALELGSNFTSKSQSFASSNNQSHNSKNTTDLLSTQLDRKKNIVAQESSVNIEKPMSNTEKDNSKCKIGTLSTLSSGSNFTSRSQSLASSSNQTHNSKNTIVSLSTQLDRNKNELNTEKDNTKCKVVVQTLSVLDLKSNFTCKSVPTQSHSNKSAVAQESCVNTEQTTLSTERDNDKCKVVLPDLMLPPFYLGSNFTCKSQSLVSSSNHAHNPNNTAASVSIQLDRNKIAVAQESFLNTEQTTLNTKRDNNKCKVVVQTLPALDLGCISGMELCISDVNIVHKPWPKEEMCNCEKSDAYRNSDHNHYCSLHNSNNVKSEAKITYDHVKKRSSSHYSDNRSFCKRKKILSTSSGVGKKLLDIDGVADKIRNSSSTLLRVLHYVLYSKFESCQSDFSIIQAKVNILRFSGFPFNRHSAYYKKKILCLERMPYPVLFEIYKTLIGAKSTSRFDIAHELIEFLLEPSVEILKSLKANVYLEYSSEEIAVMTAFALRGPAPVVYLEKIDDEFIKRFTKRKKVKYTSIDNSLVVESSEEYSKSSFVLPGPGVKLKKLAAVTQKVLTCRRRLINLLHCIFYGRPGSDKVNRLNILEFSGFSNHNKSDLARANILLQRLKTEDILQICDIFSLPATGVNKCWKIRRLLKFFKAPTAMYKRKKRVCSKTAQQCKIKKECSKDEIKPEPVKLDHVKLRDFETICTNIECATPEDLAELNDLLFVKPCDNTEIHQKILDFAHFSFNEHSFDYQYRKTLLHYMSLNIKKKIAQLLDISGWDSLTHEQDLAMKILKFLMTMKKMAGKPLSKKEQSIPPLQTIKKNNCALSTSNPHVLKLDCLQTDKNKESFKSQKNGFEKSPPEMADFLLPELNLVKYEKESFKEQTSKTNFCNSFQSKAQNLTPKESVPCEKTTLRDLINHSTVHAYYSEFDLKYKVDFLAKTEILQEMKPINL